MSRISGLLPDTSAPWSRDFFRWLTVGGIVFIAFAVVMQLDRGIFKETIQGDLAIALGLTGNSLSPQGNWLAEDGPVEYLTAIFAFAAALLLLGSYLQLRKNQFFTTSHAAFPLITLFAVMAFLAGEEISWGQRIFSFETPDLLKDTNRQKEFNLHNLGVLHDYKDGVLTIGIFVWAIVWPIANLISAGTRKLQSHFWIPLPPISYAPLFAASIGFRLVFKPLHGYGAQEVMECLFTFAMVLLAIHAFRAPKDLYR